MLVCTVGLSTPLQPKCSKDTVFRSKKETKREGGVCEKDQSFRCRGRKGSCRTSKAENSKHMWGTKNKTRKHFQRIENSTVFLSVSFRKQKAKNVRRFWCRRLKKLSLYLSRLIGFPVFTSADHSRPNVLVSSTAVTSFSYSIEKDGYGGRSRRLKQVCALGNEVILPHFSTQNLRGPLLPRREAKPS